MPTPSDQEEENSAALLLSMGHVMTAWQAIEHAVFNLYRCFFAADHSDVAAITFFSIRTFEARTRAAGALVIQFGSDEQKATWGRISQKIRNKAKVRNAVAHGLFLFVGKSPKRKAMIGPSVFDISNFPHVPRDNNFYSENALKNSALSFSHFAGELAAFTAVLSEDKILQRRIRVRPQNIEIMKCVIR